jgi:hypothetical protein
MTMKKSRIILMVTMLIGSALLFSACAKTTSYSKDEAVAGALNASYLLGKESITLANGVFEKPVAPGSAAVNKTQVWEQPVVGDLNADGKEDAAVALINSPGGSGTFYYIAAAIKDVDTKKLKGTNTVLLGDRIQLSNVSIENGIITVAYIARKPGEAMTAAPSVAVSKKFKVENGSLKEITSEAEGNPTGNNKAAYTLSKTAHKNNSNVYFPQLTESKGELLKGYINQSLKKVADKYVGKDEYTNVKIDYVVTRQDDTVLSVLFKGTADMKNIGGIKIMESVNLDIEKSTNEIRYDNLIKNTDEAKSYLNTKLTQAARGIKGGFHAEGVRIYFTGTDIVFFYMPPDDSAKDFVELSIPKAELEQYLNRDFGPIPAS